MQNDFILLDRSGSMASLWEEAISSINGYVKKLAEDGVDTVVTVAAFDGQGGLDFQVIRNGIFPQSWGDIGTKEVEPRGMTPLSDAVGRIVNMAKASNPEKAAIIIMTDGGENASQELTVKQAKDLLDECRAKNWQVVFLGANFDNASQAASYGNSVRSTYTVATGNLMASATLMASKRGMYGSGAAATMSWSDDEKEELATPKADKAKKAKKAKK